ncbi:HotDog domain-containing protein [Xylariomycetidae sp. FL2044]|nr:HotDog domain-containing protein [Xylariomycetidae sp. FL2044]
MGKQEETWVSGMLKATDGYEGIERVNRHLKFSRDFYEKYPDAKDWSSSIFPVLSIVSHSTELPHPSITFRMTVQLMHTNGLFNLHGGCTATIFDMCTTFPLHLISKPGYWRTLGVTRTLNVTCLRPIPMGSTVDIECEIVQVGRKLCTLRGTMRSVREDGEQGAVLALCEHGKVSTDPVETL